MNLTTAETDSLFKALADPTRRKIIALLSASNQSVKELTAAFAISQPAVSQHLRELRAAKLVAADKVGVRQQYRLTGEPLKAVYDWSSQYRRFFDPAGHLWELAPAGSTKPRKFGSRRNGR